MIKFITGLKPAGWIATAVAVLVVVFTIRYVLLGFNKWHYKVFILPKVEEVRKPLEGSVKRMKLDSIAISNDKVVLASRIHELQKVILELRNFKKESDKCKKEVAFYRDNPVRVDLVTIRLNIFGKVKDSTYLHTWKWVKE